MAINTLGYRFASTVHRSYNTYIARLDYNVNRNNMLFWRGNLMDDRGAGHSAISRATRFEHAR